MLNTCSGARARGRAQRLPPKSKQRYLFRLLLPSHYTLFMTTVTRAPLLLRVRAEKTGRGGNPFTWRHASSTSCGNMCSPCAAARSRATHQHDTPILLLEPPASASSYDNMFSRFVAAAEPSGRQHNTPGSAT